MPAVQPLSIVVKPGVKYTPHPHHRNAWPKKSQWTIGEPDELSSFNRSLDQLWVDEHEAWGLHFNQDRLEYLGTAQDHATNVFIAKFIDTSTNGDWHGYPADHQAETHHRPSQLITQKWLEENVVPRAKLRKIIKGQPCKL